MRDMIDRHGERFLSRVFTPREIEYCRPRVTYAQSFAARFAAKEAVFKAAGTGLIQGMRWRDVEVVNNSQGRPAIQLSGVTAEMLAGRNIHLSLSHTDQVAIAMVVVEE